MPNTSTTIEAERAKLAGTERDIVEGEVRVTEQMIHALALRVAGRDATPEEEDLLALQHAVRRLRVERAAILATITGLEATP